MRTAFIRTLEEEAELNDRLCLAVGDLGFGVVMEFAKRFPRQFLNVGIAEQNMIGVAAGMASSGRRIFAYSIANFPTIRPLEQVRNDVCYHNADVKIVAVGGGFAYGALGPTHFATEDLAVMRAMPNIAVVAPGDPWEAAAATRMLARHEGPAYLRLGRAGEPTVHSGDVTFELGKAFRVREGRDVTLIAIGGMVHSAMLAAEALQKDSIECRVLSIGSLKPIDEAAILAAARETSAILTVEEHSVIGGLGSAVAEVLSESEASPRFKRLGVPSEFPSRVGDQEWFLSKYGLDPTGISDSVKSLLTQ